MTSATQRLDVVRMAVAGASVACISLWWTPCFRNLLTARDVSLAQLHHSGRAFWSTVTIVAVLVVGGLTGLVSLARKDGHLQRFTFILACFAAVGVALVGSSSLLRRIPGTACAGPGNVTGCSSRPLDFPPAWGFVVLTLMAAALAAAFVPARLVHLVRRLPRRVASAAIAIGAVATSVSLAAPIYRNVHRRFVTVSEVRGWHSPLAVACAILADVVLVLLLSRAPRALVDTGAVAATVCAAAAGMVLPISPYGEGLWVRHDLGGTVVTASIWVGWPYALLICGAAAVLIGALGRQCEDER